MQIVQEEQLGSETNCRPRSPCGEIKPHKLWLENPVGVVVGQETPSLTGEFFGEARGILECTQAHPPVNQHLKWPNLIVGSEGSDRKWGESRASSSDWSVRSLTPPPHTP